MDAIICVFVGGDRMKYDGEGDFFRLLFGQACLRQSIALAAGTDHWVDTSQNYELVVQNWLYFCFVAPK